LPSTWYLAHISAGDFEVIGGTFPGTPAVALGRNRFIAWGATNVAADVEDLYREHLDADGTHSEYRGAQEPVTVIPETILVKGATPVQLNVRVTRHGPLVSDAINATNAESKTTPKAPPIEPLAFRWTALDADDGTLTAFLKVNEAHNWTEFTDALRGYVVPSQNFVYADVNGHIGYYAPGRIPMRASGDGSRPAEGWTGDAEWIGWVPFEDLRHRHRQPPAGAAVLSIQSRPRVDGAVSGSADHRPAGRKAAIHVRRFRTHPGRHRVVACEVAVADPPGAIGSHDVRRCGDDRCAAAMEF
jgi:penicillin amidase